MNSIRLQTTRLVKACKTNAVGTFYHRTRVEADVISLLLRSTSADKFRHRIFRLRLLTLRCECMRAVDLFMPGDGAPFQGLIFLWSVFPRALPWAEVGARLWR